MAEITADNYRFLTDSELAAAYHANERSLDAAQGFGVAGGLAAHVEDVLRRRRLIVRECNRRKLQPWLP